MGDAIKVFVRVRPPSGDNDGRKCLTVDGSNNAIIIKSSPVKVFTYDKVVDVDSTQVSFFCFTSTFSQ